MLFNSLSFLIFLGVVVLVYYQLPFRHRWLWLLACSYFFYARWEPLNLIYLVIATTSAWLCGQGMKTAQSKATRRGYLLAGLLVNLGMLIFFKFYDFLAGELEWGLKAGGLIEAGVSLPLLHLRMPVGLSFFTFGVVTYLTDVYLGRMLAESHLGRFSLFVAYFPKLFAGPIERARNFLPRLTVPVRFDPELFTSGLQLILWGLFKKVVIADNLAPLVDSGFAAPQYTPPLVLVIAIYAFAFQIYCDFSGYTDIAIGTARLMGFDLMENFRRPYLSLSTSEFWARRWHISLGTWFRDYMYIPMGGSRHATIRTYFNMMAVFMVSGLWHAGLGYGVSWAFLIWGALNGLYQWGSLAGASAWNKLGERLPRVRDGMPLHILRVLFTFHLITFAWIFFRAGSTTEAFTIIQRIGANLDKLPRYLMLFPYSADHFLALGLVVFLLAVEIFDERKGLWKRLGKAPRFIRWGFYYGLIFALLILGRWQAQEFIYMQF